MSTVTSDILISLDGFAFGEGYGPYFGYGGPELQSWIDAESARDQRVLMGRNTFGQLLKYGGASDPVLSRLPKLVVTRKGVDTSDWENADALTGEAATTIAGLKSESGPPMRTFGSLSLVRNLLAAKLIDRLRLLVFPILLGPKGGEPFFAGVDELALDLLNISTFDGRIVLMEYGPATRAANPLEK